MFMMFKKNYINPKLSKYIKEENNKWLKKYSNYKNDVGLSVAHLVKQKPNNFNNFNNFNNSSFFLIMLTSFITFFLGYNSSILIK